jgi:RNA polymerase sigma factor (sigma-70 family)
MTPLLAQRPRTDRAFERMYQRHVGDVYRYALAVMRNPADAEDVTQTTFLNAYRAFVEKGNRPEKTQNWLIAIAHNVCRQRFRQSARRPSEVAFEDDIADTFAADDVPSGDDIRRALGHLAFNQRAALVMRELEGRSYAEIADILDVSTSAVETLIFRARRALREQLDGSLTCGEAEFAISRQLDGRLPRQERAQLRAHLRECQECGTFARRQRAQRGAIKSLALVPVPGSLTSLFGGGGGGGALGTSLALKAAAVVTAGLVIGGAGVTTVKRAPWRAHAVAAPAVPVFGSVSPAASVPAPREHIPVVHAAHVVRSPRRVHSHTAKLAKHSSRSHVVEARAAAHGRARGHVKRTVVPAHSVVHPTQHVRSTHFVVHARGKAHAASSKPKASKPKPVPAPAAAHGGGNGNGKKP